MTKQKFISMVDVEGFQQRYDLQVRLNPHINILYGKNGKGKTTLLHIIANAIEHDFSRFQYVQFKKILLVSGEGNFLEITKGNQSADIFVHLDGKLISSLNNQFQIANHDKMELAKAFGGPPTYLPAFRSILEGVDSQPFTPDQNEPAVNRIFQMEKRLADANIHKMMQQDRSIPYGLWLDDHWARRVSNNTWLCRKWFGDFVPTIRYPSVSDVKHGMIDEWNSAVREINTGEQNMFRTTFLNTINYVTEGKNSIPYRTENILKELVALVEWTMSNSVQKASQEIYRELQASLATVDSSDESAAPILEIYRNALHRSAERELALLRPLRQFELTVNAFLKDKKIVIGHNESAFVPTGKLSVTFNGSAYELESLSSGERQIVTMLYFATRDFVANGVVLIDEPEISLHVDWQRKILSQISSHAPDKQIIACTHSPEIGADHLKETQDFDPYLNLEYA